MPSSFFLPRRVILEMKFLLMLVLTSFWQVSMKTLVSSSFLLFYGLEVLSSTTNTIMLNLRSLLSLRFSTLSLTTCDKSAITVLIIIIIIMVIFKCYFSGEFIALS